MLLAGDVGGTKTLLGLFKAIGSRPPQVAAREYSTLGFPSLAAMIEDFIKAVGSSSRIEAACFGVAGPVIGNAGRLTNVPWRVDGEEIAGTFGISHVSLLNDLAMAQVPVSTDELHTLQRALAATATSP
jgi:glucokinase